MAIDWITNPQAHGARFGSVKPDVTEAIIGRKSQSSFVIGGGSNFDPTSTAGKNTLPDPAQWEAIYDGSFYGNPVACLVTILGVRTTDPTTTPHVTLQNIATKWVPGDGSYEDRCITGWRDIFRDHVTQRMLVRLWHEPATSDWLRDTVAYGPAWRKVYEFFQTIPEAQRPLFVWCPNGYLASSKTPNDHAEWWPGDAWVDWVGVDAYSHISNGMPSYTGLADWYAAYNPTTGPKNPSHKPMMICEWGIDSADGTGPSAGLPTRADVFAEFCGHVGRTGRWRNGLLKKAYPDIKALTYWTTGADGCNQDGNIGLTDCPPGFQANFQAWLDNRYMNP